MPADDEARRPDPAGAAARSMTQLAQQMKDMAERLLSGALPGWPLPGAAGTGTSSGPGAAPTGNGPGTAVGRAGAAGSGGAGSGGSRPAMPGLPAIPGMPPMAGIPPMPATMSARQLQAVVDDIAARRSQVQALIASLTVFDEQLGTLETSLGPLLQWLRTWSDLEGAVADFWTPRPPRS